MFELVIQNELLENNNLFLKIHQQTKNTRGFHSHVTFQIIGSNPTTQDNSEANHHRQYLGPQNLSYGRNSSHNIKISHLRHYPI